MIQYFEGDFNVSTPLRQLAFALLLWRLRLAVIHLGQ